MVDEDGRVYIYYGLEDLCKELERSPTNIKLNMKELVDAGLVEKYQGVKGRANMIYVKVPETSLIQGTQNGPYNGPKMGHTRDRFWTPNNNNNNIFINNKYIYGRIHFERRKKDIYRE